MRRIVFAAVCLLFLFAANVVHAAVAIDFDAGSTCQNASVQFPYCAGAQASGLSVQATGTVAAASNSAMVCGIYYQTAGTTFSGTSVQWNGTDNLTKITNASKSGTNGTVELWAGKITNGAPVVNGSVVFNWTGGNTRVSIDCITLKGVNQATPAANGTNAGGTSASPSTGAITSATGDMVFGLFGDDGGGSASISVDNTAVFTSTAGRVNGENRAAGAATVTLGATLGGSDAWIAVGADIQAAAAAASLHMMPLLGVGH